MVEAVEEAPPSSRKREEIEWGDGGFQNRQ
jgi:hypothetical protein